MALNVVDKEIACTDRDVQRSAAILRVGRQLPT